MRSRALLFVAFLAAGCGRKLPPLPPVEVLPVRPQPLTVTQEGSDAILRFPVSKSTTTGEPISSLSAIQVYRELLPAGSAASPPPPPEGPLLEREEKNFLLRAERVRRLEETEIDQAFFEGDLMVRDSLTRLFEEKRLGKVFVRYGVTAVMGKKSESQLSPLVAIKPLLPHSWPEGLQAAVEERGVCIIWRPPTEMLDGSEPRKVEAYLLYRRPAGGDAIYEDPLAVLKGEATFLDPIQEAGKAFFYTVRASVTQGPPFVLGPPAAEVLVFVNDVFPPPAPTGLQVLREPEGVRLVWNPVEARDLDSYRLYRTDPATGNTRLVSGSLLDTTFFERGAASTEGYFVTALDKSGNESPRAVEQTGKGTP